MSIEERRGTRAAVLGVRLKLRRDDTDVGRVDRDVHLLYRSV
jgi:hypothetical protein